MFDDILGTVIKKTKEIDLSKKVEKSIDPLAGTEIPGHNHGGSYASNTCKGNIGNCGDQCNCSEPEDNGKDLKDGECEEKYEEKCEEDCTSGC